ncbi:MAG: ferritin-like domain-containing protein [Solirubrobacterales bacterium]
MAANRIMLGGARRRARRAVTAALAVLALTAALAACGSSADQSTSTAAQDRAGDAAILNGVLARQEAAAVAYQAAMRWLPEPVLALAREFQAQEEEHVDATLKALRGLGEAAEPRPEAIPVPRLRSKDDALTFLYDLEAATIEAENSATGALTSTGARMLLASTMANQAQHLVWLRRALGARPVETMPSAFENGSVAAP